MNFRTHQSIRIKSYLKNNDVLLFSNGIRQSNANWVQVEQNLKKLNLNFYKTYNKLTIKVLKNSIFCNFTQLVSGLFFFLNIDQKKAFINKSVLFSDKLKSLFFSLIILKLNNKVYFLIQTRKLMSLNYKSNISIFYQHLLIHLKSCSIIKLLSNKSK